MTLTFPAAATVTRKAFWLGAEPNWTMLGVEGGLPSPAYDRLVRCYCDLATKATFAVTLDDGLAGWVAEEDRDTASWAGYEWGQDGTAWELSYQGERCWWIVDDLLWGALWESVLAVVGKDHLVATPEAITRRCFESGLVAPASVARSVIELWWGPLTPDQEVRLGLTQAEVDDDEDNLSDLFNQLHP